MWIMDCLPAAVSSRRRTPWQPSSYRPRRPRGGSPLRDRKSTRLNSSHPSISYAVFCLKKTKAAQRVDLSRYQSFHMERLSATDGIYCFYGKSRDIPDDERIFLLADVLDRPAEEGVDPADFGPTFERAFHEAGRTLRHILSTREPGRRLQWNRVVLFLVHPMSFFFSDAPTTEIYTLSLHDALPISTPSSGRLRRSTACAAHSNSIASTYRAWLTISPAFPRTGSPSWRDPRCCSRPP